MLKWNLKKQDRVVQKQNAEIQSVQFQIPMFFLCHNDKLVLMHIALVVSVV
jgi:energy-converting hydrogenase Eha subunit E